VPENIAAEELLHILNRLPSAPWSSRIDPVTMTSEWVYRSPRMAELYGLTEAESHGNTLSILERMVPEDAARLRQIIAVSLRTLAPINWVGRVILGSGEARWIETQITLEREADGKIRSYGQAFDISEQKRMEELHRAVIDAMPTGIVAMTLDGKLPIYNRAAGKYAGRPHESQSDLAQAFGVFKTDGATPFPQEDLPLLRAIKGEEAPEAEMIVRNGDLEKDTWVHVAGTPIRDVAGQIIAGLVIFNDITAQRELEQELRASNAHLEESEQGKTVMIDQLRGAIEEISTPILEVWDDVLVMPIIGSIDARRIMEMVQRLLVEVVRVQASFIIVDLTGVEVVDARTADHLSKLIRKVELVGARCVLTGIRPAVSEALVDLGMDFDRITTLRNLKHGLREALRHARREREGLQDDRLVEEPSEAPRRERARDPRAA
jgi:rsbT co-antagonist protein RsbR